MQAKKKQNTKKQKLICKGFDEPAKLCDFVNKYNIKPFAITGSPRAYFVYFYVD